MKYDNSHAVSLDNVLKCESWEKEFYLTLYSFQTTSVYAQWLATSLFWYCKLRRYRSSAESRETRFLRIRLLLQTTRDSWVAPAGGPPNRWPDLLNCLEFGHVLARCDHFLEFMFEIRRINFFINWWWQSRQQFHQNYFKCNVKYEGGQKSPLDSKQKVLISGNWNSVFEINSL